MPVDEPFRDDEAAVDDLEAEGPGEAGRREVDERGEAVGGRDC